MTLAHRTRLIACALSLAVPGVTLAAQGTAAPAKHHSKLKGAVVGAVAGHMLGGHAKAGAVAGALVQHHRNKKALSAAPKR